MGPAVGERGAGGREGPHVNAGAGPRIYTWFNIPGLIFDRFQTESCESTFSLYGVSLSREKPFPNFDGKKDILK